MKRLLVAIALAGCGAPVAATVGTSSLTRVAYPNGKARFEFALRNGLPNGRGRAWHANGKLAFEGAYRNGARHGRFWFYGEDGTPQGQVVYFDNGEVWRSADPDQEPPAEWTSELPRIARGAPAEAEVVKLQATDDDPQALRTAEARPLFTTMDRTAVARAGMQVGIGTAGDLDFGAATRIDVFGHYRRKAFGAYAQVSQTELDAPMETHQQDIAEKTLAGRRTIELGGTYHRPIRQLGTLSARAGVALPIAHDDAAGRTASAIGAAQRPTDAALAVPSALTMRSGASLLRTRGSLVLQADAGVDWVFGGDERDFDALLRGNIAIGLGTARTLLSAELDTTARLSDPAQRLHALAIGVAVAVRRIGISGAIVFGRDTAFITTVSHDL